MEYRGKNVVVVGAGRGIGRRVVELAARRGARTLAVSRNSQDLHQIRQDHPEVETLSLDATITDAPERVFAKLLPDVLVITAGSLPPLAPLQELSWEEFSTNWETDVRISFAFCQAALRLPLAPTSSIILISSGAAISGSPLSGGYAGAKRTQMFLANYAQKESNRLGLALRFAALCPRIIPESDFGSRAVKGYANHLGISETSFVAGMVSVPTLFDMASAVSEVISNHSLVAGSSYVVSGNGLECILQ